jgi:hypothetical protein
VSATNDCNKKIVTGHATAPADSGGNGKHGSLDEGAGRCLCARARAPKDKARPPSGALFGYYTHYTYSGPQHVRRGAWHTGRKWCKGPCGKHGQGERHLEGCLGVLSSLMSKVFGLVSHALSHALSLRSTVSSVEEHVSRRTCLTKNMSHR